MKNRRKEAVVVFTRHKVEAHNRKTSTLYNLPIEHC